MVKQGSETETLVTRGPQGQLGKVARAVFKVILLTVLSWELAWVNQGRPKVKQTQGFPFGSEEELIPKQL